MAFYTLSKHVYSCINNNCLVFLDTLRDEYCALPHDITARLSGLANHGYVNADDYINDNKISDVIKNLLEENIIIESSSPDCLKTRGAKLDVPQIDLTDASLYSYPSFTFKTFLVFIISLLTAIWSSKMMAMHKTLKFISDRGINKQRKNPSVQEIRELMISFRAIRSFFYTAKDYCYLDCLTTIIYLNYFGIFPDWVFAVKYGPFSAHCWVQLNSIIITDHLSNMNYFTPIMIVKQEG